MDVCSLQATDKLARSWRWVEEIFCLLSMGNTLQVFEKVPVIFTFSVNEQEFSICDASIFYLVHWNLLADIPEPFKEEYMDVCSNLLATVCNPLRNYIPELNF